MGSRGQSRIFKRRLSKFMAKIVQVLTRQGEDYDDAVANSLVRDLDGIVQKLNSTYQQELKEEVEARNFFLM
jgi:hypothetical protein